MKKIVWVLLVFHTGCQAQDKTFEPFSKQFVSGYRSLNIPGLSLSYIENFQAIKKIDSIILQINFFSSIRKKLLKFDRDKLSIGEKDDYDLVAYETNLNLERLALEKKWLAEKQDTISKKGLFSLSNGKAWYAYFLKKWVVADVTPDGIFAFGLSEVERVKNKIVEVRKQTGLNEIDFYKQLNTNSFFLTAREDIQRAFEKTKQTVYKNLHNIFNVQKIPEVSIVKGTEESLAQTPGYYSGNTFYYNYFNKPYNKRQVDWLFIHEAVPGHHYQGSIARQAKQSDVQRLFYYLGFSEGWAAYTEELGKEIGLYQTPYDEYGKWEWDIVRSVRVVLDVALNYYGWSDEQALVFWKKNIYNQDDIAQREINRMRRWPAQVVAYKYGAAQIMKWKAKLQKGDDQFFNIKTFHDNVLNKGSLPFFIIERNVMGQQ